MLLSQKRKNLYSQYDIIIIWGEDKKAINEQD